MQSALTSSIHAKQTFFSNRLMFPDSCFPNDVEFLKNDSLRSVGILNGIPGGLAVGTYLTPPAFPDAKKVVCQTSNVWLLVCWFFVFWGVFCCCFFYLVFCLFVLVLFHKVVNTIPAWRCGMDFTSFISFFLFYFSSFFLSFFRFCLHGFCVVQSSLNFCVSVLHKVTKNLQYIHAIKDFLIL